MNEKVCKNCHWYLMTTACLKRYDMRKGLIGLCEHFLPYCKTKEEFETLNQIKETTKDV